jgi:putative oxidoreductase
MVQLGAPMPVLAAVVATFIELPVAFAVAVGAFARPSALLMFFYTLGTTLIGHRYWTITGADRVDGMDGFYKNLSIMGGFLLLYMTGAGKRFDRCIVRYRAIVPAKTRSDQGHRIAPLRSARQ